MDEMVLKTQQYLNRIYSGTKGYNIIDENGKTGWTTIYALIRALQIELGASVPADNFGETTTKLFKSTYPNGIKQQDPDDNSTNRVYAIIQGALWCKGYSTGGSGISEHFYDGTGSAIIKLKKDAGLISPDSTVTLNVMKALLSMDQFVLLSSYGGNSNIRLIQQRLNAEYEDYIGIIPCDGLYGRAMNTALIKVLQAAEGYSPDVATGNFGNATRSGLVTLTLNNYNNYSEMFHVVVYALVCLGLLDIITVDWNIYFTTALERFQSVYALHFTGKVDEDTWMSLLTSKGNPDRSCIACDTRFEVTENFISKLKQDGYQIVGRYLTGTSFKVIRDGELERIVNSGLKFFPIFQENGNELSYFTFEQGKIDAMKAREAAIRFGIPRTVIYFAVDMDVLDYQIDMNILPYFRGIYMSMGAAYAIGIYSSRNVCTKISKAGYAVSSFVSDMSTGYSGNLGFSIPDNWNYDQFCELNNYGGLWDLDKNAYSGKIAACDTIEDYFLADYNMPPDQNTSGITITMMDIIDLIRQLEDAYEDFRKCYPVYSLNDLTYHPQSTTEGVLNYLSKKYYMDESLMSNVKFMSAVQPFDYYFDAYLTTQAAELKAKIDTHISLDASEVTDGIGGKNDIAHLAISTLAYICASLAPDFWASWGGDLATGMDNIHKVMNSNFDDNQKIGNSYDLHEVASSLIGGGNMPMSDYFIDNHIMNVEYSCNYTDLCDDADAIAISYAVKKVGTNETHILSDVMSQYYGNLSTVYRYSQYEKNDLDYTDLSTLVDSISYKMFHWSSIAGLNKLKGEADEVEQKAAIQAFANYLYKKTHC